ncbi:MAG TPA: TadE/TadG family type IV pilus assembly protein, partial [Gemmatimonadales bacterium]|nr:TadE/TadG family type IV pilus assembly protein [Gemmatimonadales bacterium]
RPAADHHLQRVLRAPTTRRQAGLLTLGTQRGQAIVLIALMLTVLTGMAAIAIDGARAYALRRDLQAAVDSASLAASDKLQQSGSYAGAEQAATSNFANNLRLYGGPSCTPYGTPGAAAWTVTCTFADGTVLTEVAQGLGPRGSQFSITATRPLQLQFSRILTNGVNPTLAAASTGNVNNLLYTPALGALNQSGCGGAAGTAISVNGSGTLSVNGDMVANGSVTVAAGAVRVAGDLYARCQGSVAGSVSACYPSGASTPCGYPDTAGAVRAGSRIVDPGFPAPGPAGAGVGLPGSNVVVPAGIYSALAVLNSGKCWFLSGGVYTFQLGAQNLGDFASNELKPPDEPVYNDNTARATAQFCDTNGVKCAGSFQMSRDTGGTGNVATGNWAFVVTSVRSDVYNGVSYLRESAPSMCQVINVNPHFNSVQLDVSNVPGATSYNIYAAPPDNGCAGPFGLADNLPVSGSVLNSNTNPCPAFTGNGCSLGHESIVLDDELASPFAPNAAAAPGTTGAYPPDSELAPLAAGLPNQNAARGPGSRGDRANENNCETVGGVFTGCPAAITPGAVALYFPAGGCMVFGNGGDTYLFSGYQYNWVSVYEPGTASPPANGCANTLGAAANTALIGFVYAPSASVSVTSPHTFEGPGTGGVMAASLSFSGALPSVTYSALYAPVPPASRLTA